MNSITMIDPITFPALPGVTVFPFGKVRAGEEQKVLVRCLPGMEIPLHTHTVDAQMYVVCGSAKILSERPEVNGQVVGPGTCVFFEKNIAHGFKAGDQGFSFVSSNGGIVDEDDAKWDIQFV